MFPTDNQLFIESSVRKALGKYLLKKYYWNSSRLREIIEVFGESKYNVIHETGSCSFIITVRQNNKKIQFSCRDIENELREEGIEVRNVRDSDIYRIVAGICNKKLES